IRDPAAANADGNALARNLAVETLAVKLAFQHLLDHRSDAARKILANIEHSRKLHNHQSNRGFGKDTTSVMPSRRRCVSMRFQQTSRLPAYRNGSGPTETIATLRACQLMSEHPRSSSSRQRMLSFLLSNHFAVTCGHGPVRNFLYRIGSMT